MCVVLDMGIGGCRLLTDDEGKRPAERFDAIQCFYASLLLITMITIIVIIKFVSP